MAKQLGQETRSIAKIGEPIEKLQLLRGLGAEDWDLDVIPANRQRLLAQYVRHATSQAIGRRDPAFRHPALLAFWADAAARITDEIVDLLDDGVAAQHAKARRALVQQKLDVADSANASVVLLGSCWRSCWSAANGRIRSPPAGPAFSTRSFRP